MTIAVMFEAEGMTADQYNAIRDEVASFAYGRMYHVAGPTPEGNWRVVDVWESPQALDTFVKEKLMPIFQRGGIQMPKPLMWEVYDILVGDEV